MKLSTAIEKAANATERFCAQYRDMPYGWKFSSGKTVDEQKDALAASDQSPVAVARILSPGWAYVECDGCEKLRPAVVLFKREWGDGGGAICKTCAEKTLRMLDAFPDADKEINEHRYGGLGQ